MGLLKKPGTKRGRSVFVRRIPIVIGMCAPGCPGRARAPAPTRSPGFFQQPPPVRVSQAMVSVDDANARTSTSGFSYAISFTSPRPAITAQMLTSTLARMLPPAATIEPFRSSSCVS